ncbi:MAG: lysophosphatidic acid acyltransferase [marine bacterium B5-7]|nr:MAG: lysophosphatidic acid acyltransferase [marine bacterium B5-7]
MTLLRSIVFFIGMCVSIVLYWPITMLAWPLLPLTRSRILGGWAVFTLWWLKVTCNLRHRVSGLENLPDRPAVLLCKHESAWETISTQAIFPPQAWVLKRELLWIPFFGWSLAASNPIAINRSARVRALDQLIREGRDRLREGRWVVVFPEGTRTAPGEMGEFSPGGAMLAVKSGAPVVPVAHNAGTFWRRRGILKHAGVIDVRVGPVIETAGRKPRDVNNAAHAWIAQAVADMAANRDEQAPH